MQKRQKILFIITKSVCGGAGKYVYDLATRLPKERFSVSVAAGGTGELFERLRSAGIKTWRIAHFRRDVVMLSDIAAGLETLRLFLRERPDIIHVNSAKAGGVVGVAALISRAVAGAPRLRVFTAHGWTFHEQRPRLHLALIRFFSKITAYCYQRIICVSAYDCRSAIAHRIAPAHKLITIHNGIDPVTCYFLPKSEARQKLAGRIDVALKDSDLVVGAIGELHPNKNHALLIDATRKLIPRFPQLKVVIIGEGEEEKWLRKKIADLRLSRHVFLAGTLSDAAKYIRAFTIFSLPSRKEGLPYVLLEAGLAGMATVVSDAGGIPEIITDNRNGVLIPLSGEKSDAERLSNALFRLLSSSELRYELGSALAKTIQQKFALQSMIERTCALYTEFIGP